MTGGKQCRYSCNRMSGQEHQQQNLDEPSGEHNSYNQVWNVVLFLLNSHYIFSQTFRNLLFFLLLCLYDNKGKQDALLLFHRPWYLACSSFFSTGTQNKMKEANRGNQQQYYYQVDTKIWNIFGQERRTIKRYFYSYFSILMSEEFSMRFVTVS